MAQGEPFMGVTSPTLTADPQGKVEVKSVQYYGASPITNKADEAAEHIREALEFLQQNRPQERSEMARRYAIAITELEKAYAYFMQFVRGG